MRILEKEKKNKELKFCKFFKTLADKYANGFNRVLRKKINELKG